MTDRAWAEGYGQLVLAFPSRRSSARETQARGALYRRHLDCLSDGAWLHAVQAAIRGCDWFPSVASLLDWADEWRGGPTLAADEGRRLEPGRSAASLPATADAPVERDEAHALMTQVTARARK